MTKETFATENLAWQKIADTLSQAVFIVLPDHSPTCVHRA